MNWLRMLGVILALCSPSIGFVALVEAKEPGRVQFAAILLAVLVAQSIGYALVRS